jgi:3-deoxy-D-manno-octulosonic-acid transferase
VRQLLRALYAAVANVAVLVAAVVPASGDKTVMALRARRGIRRRYAAWASTNRDPERKLLWVHAASVGEALMARPVLEAIRARNHGPQLALTFFSPSAEEFSRRLDVDFREYLPFDRASDMDAVLGLLAPTALVFSKVDVWPELVRQARRRGVRLGLISASLPAGSSRLGTVTSALLRDAYATLDAVGAVDAAAAERLVALGARREVVEVTGDTAFDLALQRVSAPAPAVIAPVLDGLRSARPTLVAGSTWPADERPLFDAFLSARRRVAELRLAPHEMDAGHLQGVESWAARNGLSCARVDQVGAHADVVLVDRFGLLAFLYGCGQVSFVGGGFHGAGLHSVVEPAAHGTPVLFGPHHSRSRDASLLLAAGGARAVTDARSLERALVELFTTDPARAETGARARGVVESGRGAAARSLALVDRLLHR